MASQRKSEQGQGDERSKREQRADRILDAAGELMLRWGYNKTTIDDIARLAGVAKGTIYLHWKTREDLFWALMRREYVRLIDDVKQRVASDPEGGTLHAITKHSMLATMKSPLTKAVLLRDTGFLGEWMHKEVSSETFTQQLGQSFALIEYYRNHGVVRQDIDVSRLAYMLDSLIIGFLVAEQYMPEGLHYADEEIAEMAAEVVKRTFEPVSTAHAQPEEQVNQELADNFIATLDEIVALRSSLDREESPLR